MNGQTGFMPAGDPSQAAWLGERMERSWGRGDGGNYVASIIPTGFAAYARIFHPVKARDGGREVTWADVARHYGRTPHADMQWHAITGDGWENEFQEHHRKGHLPESQRRALVDILRTFTETPGDCWFAVWEGWGALDRKKLLGATRIKHPDRTYYLLRGPIEAVVESVLPSDYSASYQLLTRAFGEPAGESVALPPPPRPYEQSPSLWWPADRAWCVATEIDFMWTYVGGSEACIEALLGDDRLEAWPATPDHRADYYGDRINPTPPRA